MSGLVLMLIIFAAGAAASAGVKRTYHTQAQHATASNLNGKQVARAILDRHGLQHVRIEHVPGELTDHYDPKSKTVRLSDLVYEHSSVAAVSVSAHEVGHAIQDARGYLPLKLRSGLFPFAMAGQTLWMIPLLIGFVLGSLGMIWLALAMFAGSVLFQVVTLPVEFDASRRARSELQGMALVSASEAAGVKKMLRAAALTYVVAALASVLTLLWYWSMFNGRD